MEKSVLCMKYTKLYPLPHTDLPPILNSNHVWESVSQNAAEQAFLRKSVLSFSDKRAYLTRRSTIFSLLSFQMQSEAQHLVNENRFSRQVAVSDLFIFFGLFSPTFRVLCRYKRFGGEGRVCLSIVFFTKFANDILTNSINKILNIDEFIIINLLYKNKKLLQMGTPKNSSSNKSWA